MQGETMTVESRLLISHLIMFIVPIFMTVIVAAVMPAGAPTLSRGNNYLYLENISKCTRAAEISCHNFFTAIWNIRKIPPAGG